MADDASAGNGRRLGVGKTRHRKGRTAGRLRAALRSWYSRFLRSRTPSQGADARLTFVTDRVPVFIAQLDERERYVFVNRPYAGHYGRRPEDIIGRHLREVIGEQAYTELEPHVRVVLGKGRDALWETAEGAKHFQFRATVARNEDRRPHGLLIVGTDITKRRLTEIELERAKHDAEAASRAKEDFLAVLSHELRTPLSAVYGWARMLRSGQLEGEAVSRALDVIMRNADAQVRLIEDLLDVSRIIAGKMRLDVRSVDLQAVIQAAIDAVRPAADAKEIRLQCVLDPRAVGMTGDADRLQQVVWNLLINAVKFTPKRGRVQVHLQRTNSHVAIIVSDTGQGISEEQLPHIFERFHQAGSISTRSHAGLGLGLALVRHLVELHGGTVTAQSPGEGQGATFTVELPVAIAHREQEREARVHPTARAGSISAVGPSLRGVRVLVVDDDRDSLDLIHAILVGSGAEVRGCASASEGLTVLQEWRPDVLISDIEMPGEDGYTFIRKVRALDFTEGGKTPALALTAYGRIEDRLRTLSAGYGMHVSKPADPAELAAIVASLAGRSSEA
jgi:signal transduction histidine kinase/ActR/RegA family two-component response regulator